MNSTVFHYGLDFKYSLGFSQERSLDRFFKKQHSDGC
jgi:hypothetical protein